MAESNGVTVRVEGLDKRLDKLEQTLEDRDEKIYRRINGVACELRSDITRLQSAMDARFTRHAESINQQFIEIAGQIGGLKTTVHNVPSEVTQTKIDMAELKARHEFEQRTKKRSSIPPKFDPRRFMESPWVKLGIGFAIGLASAVAGYLAQQGGF